MLIMTIIREEWWTIWENDFSDSVDRWSPIDTSSALQPIWPLLTGRQPFSTFSNWTYRFAVMSEGRPLANMRTRRNPVWSRNVIMAGYQRTVRPIHDNITVNLEAKTNSFRRLVDCLCRLVCEPICPLQTLTLTSDTTTRSQRKYESSVVENASKTKENWYRWRFASCSCFANNAIRNKSHIIHLADR